MKHRVIKSLASVGIHVGVFLVLIALLWGALIQSASIPNETLKERYLTDAKAYRTVPNYSRNEAQMFRIQDNYADIALLGVSWYMGDGDPVVSSLDTKYFKEENMPLSLGLLVSVSYDTEANIDYSRYWHGNAIFVRNLYGITDINGIKTIGFVAILLLISVTLASLSKRRHWDIAFLLLLSLVAVQFWNVRFSLEYQPAFWVTFLLCPFYLWLERKNDRWLTMLSTVGGTLIAFFDFLTTETMTILIPLILVVAVRAKEERWQSTKKMLRLLLLCGICWGLAYAGTFVMKWSLTTLLTGENAFIQALSSVGERISTDIPATITSSATSFFSSLLANLSVLFWSTQRVELLRVWIGTAIVFTALLLIFAIFRAKQKKRAPALILLGLGALVLARFLILNNHSFIHEFFTYRALCATILAMLLALRLNVEWKRKKEPLPVENPTAATSPPAVTQKSKKHLPTSPKSQKRRRKEKSDHERNHLFNALSQ